jgi:hypothetical protein
MGSYPAPWTKDLLGGGFVGVFGVCVDLLVCVRVFVVAQDDWLDSLRSVPRERGELSALTSPLCLLWLQRHRPHNTF